VWFRHGFCLTKSPGSVPGKTSPERKATSTSASTCGRALGSMGQIKKLVLSDPVGSVAVDDDDDDGDDDDSFKHENMVIYNK